MDEILHVGAFDLEQALTLDPDFLSEDQHEHDETVGAIAIVTSGELDGAALQAWLSSLLQTQGPDIF